MQGNLDPTVLLADRHEIRRARRANSAARPPAGRGIFSISATASCRKRRRKMRSRLVEAVHEMGSTAASGG